MNLEEEKVLNHLIHIEEQIMHLIKSLEDQRELSEKPKKKIYIHQVLSLEFYMSLLKFKSIRGSSPSLCPIIGVTGAPTYNLA